MKKCLYCGSSVKDSEHVCPNCGGKLVSESGENSASRVPPEDIRAEETKQPLEQANKNKPYSTIASIIFVVLFFGALLTIVLCAIFA